MKQLVLKNNIQQLALLADFVDQLADELSLDPALCFNLNLVLEEAVSNVVMYAYPQDEEHELTVDALWDADTKQLSLVIKDHGVPFNPLEQAPDVDITLSAEEREIGGLGIFLVNQIMDNVEYERKDGQNILTMQKSIA